MFQLKTHLLPPNKAWMPVGMLTFTHLASSWMLPLEVRWMPVGMPVLPSLCREAEFCQTHCLQAERSPMAVSLTRVFLHSHISQALFLPALVRSLWVMLKTIPNPVQVRSLKVIRLLR